MPPHDPQHLVPPAPLSENAAHSQYPDEAARSEARSEHEAVPTSFAPETGRRAKRALSIAAAFLLVCFLAVVALRYLHARAVAEAGEAAYSAPSPVDVVIARPAVAGQDLALPGETAAWYETTIYARVNGYVANWLVDIGDKVKKGQVLAVIETPELDAELRAARAQLKSSQAQVGAREAEAEFSKTTNERWRDSPKGVVSEQERESKKADYEGAVARLNAADAQVALDRSKVEQYDALAEFKQVKAPFDGTITERKIDVGNLVTAGSGPATTPLYRMAQTDPLRVFVDVPQSAAGELMNAGVPAEIRATGAVGGVFSGKIARSAESINAQARTMRVEVDMPNATHALVPGMYVNVVFRLPPRGLVEVPASALIFRAAGAQVARVDANSKVEFKDVVIARDNGSVVELASGAQPGDRLVLNISSQIASGQTVAANEPDGVSKPVGAKR
ncbi:MAG TPA: efflux RND transporter periplasmic adaptor subunit [Steroidobacteraceae bacterium]|jgi:RND family efflux transporter MFP subunit|nr:efflux RND transporter periplasmic adaptor subunit [Steroidobacteraceae bacterium]